MYCAVASLGFATIENVFYVLTYSGVSETIWITRAFLSVPTHMLLGIIMGYYLAQYRFGTDAALAKKAFTKSLVIPAVLHGLFDLIVMLQLSFYLYLILPLVLFLWIYGMVLLRRYYRLSKLQHGK